MEVDGGPATPGGATTPGREGSPPLVTPPCTPSASSAPAPPALMPAALEFELELPQSPASPPPPPPLPPLADAPGEPVPLRASEPRDIASLGFTTRRALEEHIAGLTNCGVAATGKLTWGSFQFKYKPDGSWQATCKWHKANPVQFCRKGKAPHNLGKSDKDHADCIHWLKAWCMAGQGLNRQRDHLWGLEGHGDLPPHEILDAMDYKNAAPPNVLHDSALDSLEIAGPGPDEDGGGGGSGGAASSSGPVAPAIAKAQAKGGGAKAKAKANAKLPAKAKAAPPTAKGKPKKAPAPKATPAVPKGKGKGKKSGKGDPGEDAVGPNSSSSSSSSSSDDGADGAAPAPIMPPPVVPAIEVAADAADSGGDSSSSDSSNSSGSD